MKIKVHGLARHMGSRTISEKEVSSILDVSRFGDDGVTIESSTSHIALNGQYKIFISLSRAELEFLLERSIKAPLEDQISLELRLADFETE